MLAKRFLNLLKLLRVEHRECGIDDQCRMMDIQREELLELTRKDDTEIPQELVSRIIRGYCIGHAEFDKLQQKAAAMEWMEFCPHNKTASSLIVRDLYCQGYAISQIADTTFLSVDYIKKMCSGEAKEVPSFFEIVQDEFDYSADKIDCYIKYFSRNSTVLRLRGYTLKQRSLIWNLNHMISWLNEDACQKFMSKFEHIPPIDPSKQFQKGLDTSLYQYINALKMDHGFTNENILQNKEIWTEKDLNHLMKGQRNLSVAQLEDLRVTLHLGPIEQESLLHLNELFEPEVIFKLSTENSSVDQYDLVCDFCRKARNFQDGLCDELNGMLLDIRGSLEYIIPKTKSIMSQQLSLPSPVFSYLISQFGSDAGAAVQMQEYLGYSLSTCYAIKNGKRAFTSEVLELYVEHFNMNDIEEELLRYFAFINERYAIVDLNNYSIRSRKALNDFDHAFAHMNDEDIKEIYEIIRKVQNRVKKNTAIEWK